MSALVTHFRFEWRNGLRNKTLLMMNYLFPLGFYLMMGFIMPEINPLFRAVIIPSMVTFAVLASTLLGLPDPLVSARENGIFRSYHINGIPASSILIIPALTTALHMIVVGGVITLTARWLFDAPLPENWLGYMVVFLALIFGSVAIGLLIGVVSPDTRATVLYAQALFLPSMLLGGLMLPYGMLPEAVQQLAQLLPATHAMNAFMGLAMGETADFAPWGSVVILILNGLIAMLLARYLFQWNSHHRSTNRWRVGLALLVLVPNVIGLLLF